jgi:hypothetical protein
MALTVAQAGRVKDARRALRRQRWLAPLALALFGLWIAAALTGRLEGYPVSGGIIPMFLVLLLDPARRGGPSYEELVAFLEAQPVAETDPLVEALRPR